jgi:hypothetical protein
MESVSKGHFVEHCVSLWHTADFLTIQALKPFVEIAVRSYCDTRMKKLCMFPFHPTWRNPSYTGELRPWALDLVHGLRIAYEWRITHLKAVLMELVWVARSLTLQSGIASVLFEQLKDAPDFMDDFLGRYAAKPWMASSVWLPPRDKVASSFSSTHRLRCAKSISGEDEAGSSKGQIINAFRRDNNNGYMGGCCSNCGAGENIPWRMGRPPRSPVVRPSPQASTKALISFWFQQLRLHGSSS